MIFKMWQQNINKEMNATPTYSMGGKFGDALTVITTLAGTLPTQQITVITDPVGRDFTVDGTTYSSAQTFTWVEDSTHTLSVSSPQSGGTRTRYVYTSWSDGGAQSHTYTVPGSDATVTVNFERQYYLTVNSAHRSPTGQGWYDAGASAAFGVTTPESGGTGWLQADTWHGDDMRMSLGSGPFTLEVGVPYSVVVGYVVGQGQSNLNSIQVMKSYDKSAQTAYDLNFKLPTGVEERELDTPISTNFALHQNYPNPFNPATTISFSLPSKSLVSLKVFDALGREVATLVFEELPVGRHSRRWSPEGLSSGVYFYRLQASLFTETKKLLLLR